MFTGLQGSALNHLAEPFARPAGKQDDDWVFEFSIDKFLSLLNFTSNYPRLLHATSWPALLVWTY